MDSTFTSNNPNGIGVVHEGWQKRHPSSGEYNLKNKSYWQTLENGEAFWESFSRHIYDIYEITDRIHVVINGDGVPWIRAGVDYFPNAVYTYDRYHLKPWIKHALGYRPKEARKRCYKAADTNDPAALLAAIAEAEKAETDEHKKAEIKDLRLFVFNHQEAFRDYRDVLEEKDIHLDTSWMRPMGAGESNMNLFSRRLKKMGYSWSHNGLKSMIAALVHLFEGSLSRAIGMVRKGPHTGGEQEKVFPSYASFLSEKTRPSVGTVRGHMPSLAGADQSKPYGKALQGLAGF